MKVEVMSDILKANDLLANEIRELLKANGVTSFNIMGSPGSGKTSILERLIPMLPEKIRPAVIEGDIATTNDAERIAKTGVFATQINTRGACHLDAAMVKAAIQKIELDKINLLFIENVGNLVCPSGFDIGESKRIVVSSVSEGDDKPIKYPVMFKGVSLVILNKIDLMELSDFDEESFTKGLKKINPGATVLKVSAKTGEGFEELVRWVKENIAG